MIQTKVISEKNKKFEKHLNKALKELENHEVMDIKFAVNNDPCDRQVKRHNLCSLI